MGVGRCCPDKTGLDEERRGLCVQGTFGTQDHLAQAWGWPRRSITITVALGRRRGGPASLTSGVRDRPSLSAMDLHTPWVLGSPLVLGCRGECRDARF